MIKVLIVDDDNLVRKGLISILPWEQYSMEVVGEAKNGEKALEFLASNKVDLMLTDLAMPVMSGMELMRIARKQYPHIFIVVLTLHQDFEYIQECLRLGAIDYIVKVEMEQENFGEVMMRVKARILEEQSRNGSSIESESDDEKRLLSDLKKRGHALGWVHRTSDFERLLEDLQNLQLSPAKLTSFLHAQWIVWDRIYASVTEKHIELPDAFHSWMDAKDWLNGVRERLVDAIGKAQYSEEVKDCIARAVQAMHDELTGSVHASEMAKRVNMSRSYFSQCFKDLVGMTFNEYLRHIRMEKAKEYLQYTQKTIQWITENTGYTDQKYFSRVFHEKTGMLPSEYRQWTQSGVQVSDI
ncbi:response regulator [Paenibacillus sp. LHD-117]|uniref:response regulator transcription factor n=1 Tax=Paenibacillus sp. LHD-117 TaxID=3071412 RepID=UPI0027DFE60C|nr:response regulator [Paenibacillus sp. LHD-117]MDQ6417931.1 response regulator [Paenibacillus sp. LHD-117]